MQLPIITRDNAKNCPGIIRFGFYRGYSTVLIQLGEKRFINSNYHISPEAAGMNALGLGFVFKL